MLFAINTILMKYRNIFLKTQCVGIMMNYTKIAVNLRIHRYSFSFNFSINALISLLIFKISS